MNNLKAIPIILLHTLFWCIYVGYEIAFNVVFPDAYQNFTNYLFFYAANITIFYVHAHLVLPLIFRSKKHIFWRLPLLLFLELVLFVSIIIFDDWLKGNIEFSVGPGPLMLDITGLQYFVAPLLPYLIYSTGYFFLNRYFASQKRAREVEKLNLEQLVVQKELEIDLMRVEQDLLRAQINPHFLFNMLSFINYSTKHNTEQARKAIGMLSEFLRYAFEPSHQSGLVPLGDEAKQVENLVALNQMRFNGELNLEFKIDTEAREVKVIPLILLTLVENMFKHGELQKEGDKAMILILLNGSQLTILTTNFIKISSETTSKTGLANIVKRIDLFYGERARLDYSTGGGRFETSLTVNLNDSEMGMGSRVRASDKQNIVDMVDELIPHR